MKISTRLAVDSKPVSVPATDICIPATPDFLTAKLTAQIVIDKGHCATVSLEILSAAKTRRAVAGAAHRLGMRIPQSAHTASSSDLSRRA